MALIRCRVRRIRDVILRVGCGASAAFGCACHSGTPTEEQQTVVYDSIEVALHVPATVHLGDSVSLGIGVRNLSNSGQILEYGEPAVDFHIMSAFGRAIWRYLPENQAALGARDSLPAHGEREFSVTWDQRDTEGKHVGAGSYRVMGWFDGGPTGDIRLGPVTLEIVR